MKLYLNRPYFGFSLIFVALLLLSGCATPTKMAFESGSGEELATDKPIFLMSANIKNQYKPDYQPDLIVVNVEKEVVNGSEDRINFTLTEKGSKTSEDPQVGNHYLLRLQLDKGKYILRGLTSQKRGFLYIGTFFTPIHESLIADQPGVYYLGNIDATVRKRGEDEFKAGSSIPLLDQSIVGASGGTFDIEISDQWEKDIPEFLQKFPMLSKADIKKSILPPFNREKAQLWWEQH